MRASRPDGTLNHFKNDTSRERCLNIIRKQAKLWDGNGDFIDFLAQAYSPLNKIWSKSVKDFYYKNKNKEGENIEIS